MVWTWFSAKWQKYDIGYWFLCHHIFDAVRIYLKWLFLDTHFTINVRKFPLTFLPISTDCLCLCQYIFAPISINESMCNYMIWTWRLKNLSLHLFNKKVNNCGESICSEPHAECVLWVCIWMSILLFALRCIPNEEVNCCRSYGTWDTRFFSMG